MAESRGRASSREPSQSRAADAEQQAEDGAETEEWIFTYNTSTGALVRVERADAAGQRQELTEEEYVALSGLDPASYSALVDFAAQGYDPYSGDYAASAYDPYGYSEGYYQGQADYAQALAAYGGGSTEQAYYQGVNDYVAMLYASAYQ
jgi:hypothetical protein